MEHKFITTKRAIPKENEITIIEIGRRDKKIKVTDEVSLDVEYVEFYDNRIKNYAIIEKVTDDGIVLVDFLYGNIDFDELRNDSERLKAYVEKVLSRENIDNKIKKYFGILPMLEKNNQKMIYDMEVVSIVKNIMRKRVFYIRKDSKVVVNEMFQNKENDQSIGEPEPKKKSLFKMFIDYGTRNLEEKEVTKTSKSKKSKGTEHVTEWDFLCYRLGAVISGSNVCTRYNYSVRNITAGTEAEGDNFLVTEQNMNAIIENEDYRKKFLEEVCSIPRLKALKNKRWPYLGRINEECELEKDDYFNELFIKLNAKVKGE